MLRGRDFVSFRGQGNGAHDVSSLALDNDRIRSAFDAIVLPHLNAITTYARWLARDRDVADEIVQDTMLRALRAFGSFRGQDPKPWLLTIVRNRFYSVIRQRNRHYRSPRSSELCDSTQDPMGSDPESLLSHRELIRTIDGLIASLPHEFREVLLLRERDQLSYREISERACIPVGTVMSRLHRARAMLRACQPPADFS